jgi:hypothetical protein
VKSVSAAITRSEGEGGLHIELDVRERLSPLPARRMLGSSPVCVGGSGQDPDRLGAARANRIALVLSTTGLAVVGLWRSPPD